MNLLNMTINDLRFYSRENEITVTGNKTYKATWVNAITTHLENGKEIVDVVEDTLEELFAKADEIGNKYQSAEEIQNLADELKEIAKDVLVDLTDEAVEKIKDGYSMATSDQAIVECFGIIKTVLLAMIVIYYYANKLVKWVVNTNEVKMIMAIMVGVVSVLIMDIKYYGDRVRSSFVLWKNEVFQVVK